MATSIDIVNQALSHLGNKANVASISPPDGSTEANWASRFYTAAIYRALERHDWGFARTRGALASIANVSEVWAFAYSKPTDCLKPRRILTGDQTQYEDDSEPFTVEGTTIFTNKEDAFLVYTRPVTDAALFPPMFGDTAALELAAYLAGPILRGAEGVKAASDLRRLAGVMAAEAAASDGANDRRPETQYVPASLRARA